MIRDYDWHSIETHEDLCEAIEDILTSETNAVDYKLMLNYGDSFENYETKDFFTPYFNTKDEKSKVVTPYEVAEALLRSYRLYSRTRSFNASMGIKYDEDRTNDLSWLIAELKNDESTKIERIVITFFSDTNNSFMDERKKKHLPNKNIEFVRRNNESDEWYYGEIEGPIAGRLAGFVGEFRKTEVIIKMLEENDFDYTTEKSVDIAVETKTIQEAIKPPEIFGGTRDDKRFQRI